MPLYLDFFLFFYDDFNSQCIDEAPHKIQGKIKGYPIWFDANRVEPFLNENASPPAACPSIVNAKALGNIITSWWTLGPYFVVI